MIKAIVLSLTFAMALSDSAVHSHGGHGAHHSHGGHGAHHGGHVAVAHGGHAVHHSGHSVHVGFGDHHGGHHGGQHGGHHGGYGHHHYAPAHYEFAYGVHDPYHGTNFGHSEARNGHHAKGQYYVHLPDGRLQKVSYYTDEWGYHPTVTYEGKAHFPSHGAGHHGHGGGYH